MSTLFQVALPKPLDWQDFERKSRTLFKCVLGDPSTQLNGRTGQPQAGVDIWGCRDGNVVQLVGVQCKKSDDALTVAELESEVAKAKGFLPAIREFILVTTAPRDVRIQQRARELTAKLAQTDRPILVTVWAWEDIQENAANYAEAYRAFDPTYNPIAEQHRQEMHARLDQLAADIARDKGLPIPPLRAILIKLGEANVSEEDIPRRLDAKADELLELREELARLKRGPGELATFAERADALIAQGDLDEARSALAEGRVCARHLREQAALYEANFLAREAEVDHLQVNYLAAAAKYDEAAKTVALFDSLGYQQNLAKQAMELYLHGHEFGDSEALLRAIDIHRGMLENNSLQRKPMDWGRIQNNLGSALVALGERESSIIRLEQAVVAFREALKELTRELEPLEWAMSQDNLGIALSKIGRREHNTACLNEAVSCFHAALEVRTRANTLADWAETQNNLGSALVALGEQESGTTHLQQAVDAFGAALEGISRANAPLKWAMIQGNMGVALDTLGEREGGTGRLRQAVAAYQSALEERRRERVPLDWAATQANLGNTLRVLGHREKSTVHLKKAVEALQAALQEATQERAPLNWAENQINLGNALSSLGQQESDPARLEQAIEAYRLGLSEVTRTRAPFQWALAQNNLGAALVALAEQETGTARLEQAVEAYRAALEVRTRERTPLEWARTQHNLGGALIAIAEHESDTTHVKQAVDAYQAALEERSRVHTPIEWGATQRALGWALVIFGGRARSIAYTEQGADALRAALSTGAFSDDQTGDFLAAVETMIADYRKSLG